MSTDTYALRIYNASGALQHIVTDFVSLRYTKLVNAAGMCVFMVRGDHPIVGDMTLDWQVEVWRSNPVDEDTPTGAWAADFYGLFRDEVRSSDNDGQSFFTAYCPAQLSLLGRREVAWAAETTNRTAFTSTKAETIAKTLVDYNAGPNATTANGRIRTGTISGLTVQTDVATGNTLDWNCFGVNLLETLTALARVGGGDFDLVKTGATAWSFRWYDGQLGTDRSASVAFSLPRGNMSNPTLRRNRLNERTVAIVAGQGEGSGRAFVTRNGTNYAAGTNDTEMMIDARDVSTTSGLNSRGDVRLNEVEAKDDLAFDVIQTPASRYNLHYFLGDLVTGVYQGISSTKQIAAVTIDFDGDGNERIAVEMENA